MDIWENFLCILAFALDFVSVCVVMGSVGSCFQVTSVKVVFEGVEIKIIRSSLKLRSVIVRSSLLGLN